MLTYRRTRHRLPSMHLVVLFMDSLYQLKVLLNYSVQDVVVA